MSTIFVVGAGAKLGFAIPKLFLENGFSKVGLASRSITKLESLAAQLPSAAEIALAEFDASDLKSLQRSLEKLRERLGNPDVIVYNTSSFFMPHKSLMDMTVDDLEAHLKVSTIGGFVTGKWAVENVNRAGRRSPAVFFTGGAFAHEPRQNRAGLGIGKAALLNLVKSFRVEQPYIHWAIITVTGLVDRGDDFYASSTIAKVYWKLWKQEKDGWEVEVVH